MSEIILGPLLENDTCLQISFNRKDCHLITAMQNEGVSFKHVNQDKQTYIKVSFSHDSGLSATLNHELDFDLMNSRTRNHLRTVRKPNESKNADFIFAFSFASLRKFADASTPPYF